MKENLNSYILMNYRKLRKKEKKLCKKKKKKKKKKLYKYLWDINTKILLIHKKKIYIYI